MNNYTLPELVWSLAMLMWPVCLLILAILFKKDISRLLATRYCKKTTTNPDDIIQVREQDSVNIPSVPIETKTEPKPEERRDLHIEDDSLHVDICRNLKSEKVFIIISEIDDQKARMITPMGDIKILERILFSAPEEAELNKLKIDGLITEEQSSALDKYIDDSATRAIEEYKNSRVKSLVKEPTYVTNYRKMLDNPSTMPSRMLSYIKESKKTTWAEVKTVLSDRYGYKYSGSFSASLRVLFIDGHVDIDGGGDDKNISPL